MTEIPTEITVDGDVDAILTLDRQLQFAAAATATSVAQKSQKAAIAAIEQNFTTTNPWYLPSNYFGVHYTPATPDRPTAQVHSNAYWLVPHETGALKTPHDGPYLAVPTDAIRPDPRRPVPRSQRPANLPDAFVLQTRRGPKLFERINNQLRVIYNLVKSVHIEKRSTIVAPTIETTAKEFAPTLAQKIAEALRTAKQ